MMEVITKREVELIELINDEYDAAFDDATSVIKHALNVGKHLIEMKKLNHKNKQTGFIDWVENNCSFGKMQAYNFIKLQESSTAVDNYLKVTKEPSIIGALRYIAPEPEVKEPKPNKKQSINEVCSDLSTEIVGISSPANNFVKKAKEVIEYQDQADESALWSLKKNLRAAAERLMKLADELDVTGASFKEKIAENEKVIDLWTGEAS